MIDKLVSVIIPVYNADQYIAEAIESVINQTYPLKELILVDDGSKDNSYQICKQYECDWIKVYQLEHNMGQSYANNYGYQKAAGSLIKFFDADDILDPDFLKNILLHYNSDDDLYFSNCVNFYNNFSLKQQVKYKTETWAAMPPVDFILSPASFMRQGGRWLIPKKIIEKAGLWNEELSLINDFEYFTRLSLHSQNIRYIKDAVLYYRQVGNSLSSQSNLQAYHSAFNSIALSGDQLLAKENSPRVKRYIANSLQGLQYSIYPKHPELRNTIKMKVVKLGGADKKIDAAGITYSLSKVFGWKFALFTRYYFIKIKKSLTSKH